MGKPGATKKLFIGSRGSRLALWQAEHIKSKLKGLLTGYTIEIKIIKTSGDLNSESPAPEGIGFFTKEIESALLKGEIDLAVHSLKDLPTETPPATKLAAFPEREDARDALISKDGSILSHLAPGSIIATGSPRRRAQIKHLFPQLKFVSIRGNVDTRIKKLKEGNMSAIVLAVAGIKRLGSENVITQYLGYDLILPAPGQGALALQIREDDGELEEVCSRLDHSPTRTAVTAERSFLKRLGSGCQLPVGALGQVTDEDELKLSGVVLSPDGSRRIKDDITGSVAEAETVGVRLAERFISQGAEEILKVIS